MASDNMPCVEYDDLAMFCSRCIDIIERTDAGTSISELKEKMCDGCREKAERHCGVCNSDFTAQSLVVDNGCFDCRQPIGFRDRRGFFHSGIEKYLSAGEIKDANRDDESIVSWIDAAEVGDVSPSPGTSEIVLTCVDMPSIIFHIYK